MGLSLSQNEMQMVLGAALIICPSVAQTSAKGVFKPRKREPDISHLEDAIRVQNSCAVCLHDSPYE